MTVADPSNPPFPSTSPMILKLALATPTSTPPNAIDRNYGITPNHEIHDAFLTIFATSWTSCLKRTFVTMSNLKRLYVAINTEACLRKLEFPTPESNRHLVIPSD
ncbi:hypothetical protein FS749_016126 [Ceratobasidium sp. UAMH 11750]|nr:hypothetical protein FS749_016126 [Ceratobasidium sp. UAMH 11750]